MPNSSRLSQELGFSGAAAAFANARHTASGSRVSRLRLRNQKTRLPGVRPFRRAQPSRRRRTRFSGGPNNSSPCFSNTGKEPRRLRHHQHPAGLGADVLKGVRRSPRRIHRASRTGINRLPIHLKPKPSLRARETTRPREDGGAVADPPSAPSGPPLRNIRHRYPHPIATRSPCHPICRRGLGSALPRRHHECSFHCVLRSDTRNGSANRLKWISVTTTIRPAMPM